MRTSGGAAWMSPITRATRPSTRRPDAPPCSQQGRGSGSTPSKPRMRKAPQRVGKSASAIFLTLSKPIIPFYEMRHIRERETGFLPPFNLVPAFSAASPITLHPASGSLFAPYRLAPCTMEVVIMDNRLILITLLVKLGVAAAAASALARSRTFQRLLF